MEEENLIISIAVIGFTEGYAVDNDAIYQRVGKMFQFSDGCRSLIDQS